MSSKKQTSTYLQRRFHELGFRPVSRHGQNFLVDLNMLDFIARVADPQPDDVFLEVGTGTGSLTVRLAERAAHVVTVEIDARLAQLAQEQFEADAPITLLQHDALRNKNHLDPRVLEAVDAQLALDPARRFKLAANLPYSVATPIISTLLLAPRPPISMTVTVQREVADRIVAAPRSKDYGSLSVWIQSQCATQLVRELGPNVFWPRPKVNSAVVQIVLDPVRRLALGDLAWFHSCVRGLFMHRRKFLRSGMVSAFSWLEKPQADALLRQLELTPETRTEELSVQQIQQLVAALGQLRPTPDLV